MIFSQARCIRTGTSGSDNPHIQGFLAYPGRTRTSSDSPVLAYNWHTLAHACLHDAANSRDERKREHPKRRDRAPEFERDSHKPHPPNFA